MEPHIASSLARVETQGGDCPARDSSGRAETTRSLSDWDAGARYGPDFFCRKMHYTI
jgi:hypothetical protein